MHWLRGFVLEAVACQDDDHYLRHGILFEDLDHKGGGVVDIVELQEGLKNWSSAFYRNSDEKPLHHESQVEEEANAQAKAQKKKDEAEVQVTATCCTVEATGAETWDARHRGCWYKL
uniref:calcium-binding mitochondrial carrier protein SCaMC-1-like n=1 Tax=Callithrix jacchus TaxID=9483 RepID=UPI00159CFE0C|nr:calcium-binding mitochondrial carrier protein SCaMC-1-like [Callithrix jacchus]